MNITSVCERWPVSGKRTIHVLPISQYLKDVKKNHFLYMCVRGIDFAYFIFFIFFYFGNVPDGVAQKKNKQKDKQLYTKHALKTKDRITRTPLRCSGRVSSSCSTSDTRRVNLITNPVISSERGKDREVFTFLVRVLVFCIGGIPLAESHSVLRSG
jgi:hypothetical protein